MSKLEELIARLCPDGVEYKRLEDIIVSLKTGLNPRANFKLNESGSKYYYVTGKDIGDTQINVTDKTDRITQEALSLINKRARLEDDILLFASTGTGTVGRMAIVEKYTSDWGISETLYAIKTNNDTVISRYLMYYLFSKSAKNQFEPKISKGSVPHLKVKDLLNVKVPVPPLEVQREIVHILDSFTLLTAELTAELAAELAARQKQYEFYRDKWLAFNETVPRVKLSDIAIEMYRGNGIKREQVTTEGIPCVRYGEIYTSYNVLFSECKSHTDLASINNPKYFEYGDVLFAITGESIEDISKSIAYMGNEKCLAGGDIVVMKHNQDPRYVAYALSTKDAIKQKSMGKVKSKVVHSSVPSLKNIEIPLPSMEVQKQIADRLDSYRLLCNDITSGLPAEIEARKKQYEYYRDKLLTFKELKKEA